MRLAIVQGTRPEIIKNYSIAKALLQRQIPFRVLHTNQHRTRRMAEDIYSDMGYEPDEVMPGQYRIGRAIDWLQRVFAREKINVVLVNGDTAASVAGALAAMYMDIPVAHVEAGLRSRDPFMYEERNRIMVDAIAHSLFAYTSFEADILGKTPDIRGTVYLEGNTTVDVLSDFHSHIDQSPSETPYVFVTAHRKELTDSRDRMRKLFSALRHIASNRCDVIFPVHPRTLSAMRQHKIDERELRGISVLPPMRTFAALAATKNAVAVLTDSGCIQEEAYILGTPCITVRENTERHLTVKYGGNRLAGFDPDRIIAAIDNLPEEQSANWPKIYGAPGAGTRIVERIIAQFETSTAHTSETISTIV